MTNGPFPVPNATVPFWRTELHELDSHRSTVEIPDKQDILIIGAGFAGASVAYHLLKDTSDSERPSVTILEAREACSGATGRNGGHLRPDIFNGAASRARKRGLDVANEVTRFELENFDAVVDFIKSEGVDCDLNILDSSCVAVDEKEAAELRSLWEYMSREGSPQLSKVRYYGPEEAEEKSGVRGAVAMYTFPAAVLWPYKMVMHLLASAVAAGVNLQTHTPVHSVSAAADSEGYWTIETSRGHTRAKRVVFATNGYTSGLLPEYTNAIIPSRGTCARVVAMDPSQLPHPFPSSAVVSQSPNSFDSYWGVRPDGSYIVGGATPYRNRRELWQGVYNDSSLIEPSVPFFEQWGRKNFVGWEDAETKVANVWTGIMGYTADDVPHIGLVPGREGLHICAGFIGHGMPNVFLCARAVAKHLKDNSSNTPFAELGIPACYETSSDRLQRAREEYLARWPLDKPLVKDEN
ncbi:FAD dependent oxidoreductase [Xylariaceae sp. FL0594]|nr:FAD dependent oxidoreductase [Xylariaceae sp. FL0594]